MEGSDGPSAISSNPTAIKAAQEEMGRLDVLVCGQCHSVFHFIEEFQEHRTKEGACTQISHFRENSNNEQKAQVWAFLLWKDSQIQQESSDKDSTNSWKLYQKWCKMDTHIRDSWIAAGKTIQTFTKISNAKMQDVPRQNQITTNAEGKPVVVRKVIRNGQPEDDSKKDNKTVEAKNQKSNESFDEVEKREKPKLRPTIKLKIKSNKAGDDDRDSSDEEYIVEKILAKRFNPKKRCSEYLLKWEGFGHEHNRWEPAEHVATCKHLLEEFERNLAKKKELKAAQQQGNTKAAGRGGHPAQKTIIKTEAKPGPSTAAQVGRPMRSSKSKAMDQVKQWCGSMKDEDNDLLGKRRLDDSESDSEDGGSSAAKRTKGDTGSDEDWTGESEEERLLGRSDMIQRAFNRANAQSNGSNRASGSSTDLATSLGLQSPEGAKSNQPPVLVANAKGVVKVDPKQMPNLTSGVYVMSRKDGIIKLDSSPSGKLAVKGSPTTQGVLMVQNRDNTNVVRKQVISASQSNSVTPVKVVSKMDGSQVVTQMKVVSKPVTNKAGGTQKTEPIKIQPKPDPTQLPQIHVVTAVPAPITLQPRISTGIRPGPVTGQRSADGRPLLPRPPLRATTPTSVLGIGSTIRTPVRAPAPRQVQSQQTRQVLQKRTTAVTTQSNSVSPGNVTQIRPKFAMLSPQSKQVVKSGTSPMQQAKQSPKTPVGKPQSLLSPQQKLLMAKRKAQEAAGIIKPGGRGLLAAARATAGRGRGKLPETPTAATPGNKLKESKLAEGDGLHMEFHEVGSEESSSDGEPELPPSEADTIATTEPDSPPRPFTLCPLTGRIIGPDGEPVEQSAEPEPEPESAETPLSTIKTTTATSESIDVTTTTTTTELVLPSLDSLTEGGGIMRVEMSPGGTTGTIVQTSEPAQINLTNVSVPAPDLPCLDDTAPTVATPATTTTTPLTEAAPASESSIAPGLTTATVTSTSTIAIASTDVKTEEKISEERKVAEDTSNLVTITGEDGVVYQVAGQAEDGQTLLVTRDADGEQQCVYVTTEQQGDEGSVLTLDHAVAEAVAQLIPDQVNLASQFYVKEGGTEPAENPMVMSIMDNTNAADVTEGQEDSDGHGQVVAQVVQAEEPTPGGTRRVVLLLPDGNLMMTEVTEEQYAALGLGK
ncbi:flocculation protein FLO11 isoform X1 [Frieseomelitta varia]|uniref:flocculation protein FLO11 isoform X1 n=1 Tax=Frieseomelitta varia TaxID=561572 RepID=UPI001CB68DC9|nr:flocculation protein FLO11 isoform X1 [Frieseomelitta varia]XP_043525403.1 flocculation protein FLO11 isoform X1 [Frieseomelitta varia]